ncbi:MAG TPA: ATP synthase F0 subunit B [Blastocatellia bacterium]|nr:ATP synthase F0 subunit B [Blastocatellia bacterium]
MLTLLSFVVPLTFINPLIPRAVNVAIFFGILYFLLRKPTREFFAERFARIRAALERAAKEKAEAQARIRMIDERLAQLDSEVARIKETSQQEAAAERARLQAQTQAEIEKIRETARREIEAAKQTALVELRQFTAANTVALAEQIIRRELTPTDDAALLERASNGFKM